MFGESIQILNGECSDSMEKLSTLCVDNLQIYVQKAYKQTSGFFTFFYMKFMGKEFLMANRKGGKGSDLFDT